jgi:hypothetical protein
MTANEFPAVGATSSGAGAFVFERNQILNGLPARYVFFDEAPHNPPGAQYNGDPSYKLPVAAFVRPQCV